MKIASIDHFVLTVRSVTDACAFYERVLGMKAAEFGGGRWALSFGRQKINLHQAGKEFEPKARTAQPGTGDFCLISGEPLETVIRHLEHEGVAIEIGPVPKSGAVGPITSVYIRDPDDNLVEISEYQVSLARRRFRRGRDRSSSVRPERLVRRALGARGDRRPSVVSRPARSYGCVNRPSRSTHSPSRMT